MNDRRLAVQGGGLALVAALALVAVSASVRSASLGTSYGAASGLAQAADLLAGLAMLGAGALAWRQQPGSAWAVTAILAGVAWSAQDWIGGETQNWDMQKDLNPDNANFLAPDAPTPRFEAIAPK